MMKRINKKKLLIFAAVIAVLGGFCFWQNNWLTVSEYEFSTDKIGADLDGFRIVQISDLHNKSFGRGNRRLLEKIRQLSPDIIVITGDIADSSHTDIDRAISFAEGAQQIAPTYYVTGNHEYWLDDAELDKLLAGLKDAGTVILNNEAVTVEKGGESFVLAGVDDLSLVNFSDHCPVLKEDELNIVLAHEPQYIDDYGSFGNVDLVLTGHAHGGQFRLPFIGGIIAPDQGFFPKYTEGVHYSGDTAMIISRGLGNSVIPVRLFDFPEIVCIQAAASAGRRSQST